MANYSMKIVGLCQVNDIIPSIYHANNIPEQNQEPEKLQLIHNEDNESVNLPTVQVMEKLIRLRGARKKGFDVSNLKRYLLLSSLHNRGSGCGGTSPLVTPLAVYLVEEDGSKMGGIYCSLVVAYSKLRELVKLHFAGEDNNDPLIVVTPALNKRILKRQLCPGKIGLNLKMEEMIGECTVSFPPTNELLNQKMVSSTQTPTGL
ncbi:hypothetical protein KJ564_11740 [bacterium]|nr:hypothetical protein [bacterium]MBU1881169.1 hypothetical protein [bacterium]